MRILKLSFTIICSFWQSLFRWLPHTSWAEYFSWINLWPKTVKDSRKCQTIRLLLLSRLRERSFCNIVATWCKVHSQRDLCGLWRGHIFWLESSWLQTLQILQKLHFGRFLRQFCWIDHLFDWVEFDLKSSRWARRYQKPQHLVFLVLLNFCSCQIPYQALWKHSMINNECP